MLPHSQILKMPGHADKFGSLSMWRTLPQSKRNDQRLYRELEGQGGGDFVPLHRPFDDDGVIGVPRPQVRSVGVPCGLPAHPCGALQAVRRTAVIVYDESYGHRSAVLAERLFHHFDQPFGLGLLVGDLAQVDEHVRDAGDKVRNLVDDRSGLSRVGLHGCVSRSFVLCGNYVPGGR